MQNSTQKFYLCIDLKSFYASVECVERGLDPFKSNLVVADSSRGNGSVCLAVSPRLKELGVKNRCRVFEIPKNIDYIVAKPRMKLYMDKSAEIYSIYLKYISPEDIHVYSVDECFFDITDYIKLYEKNPYQIAKTLVDAVFKKTGISATVGIGTNMFLAKVALDITAKHSDDGVGWLDEQLFKKTIWYHKPITDIWNIGPGIAKRLEQMGIFDLHGISCADQSKLYKEFGVNAELLIDHSNGIEPCTIADIHSYKTKTKSLSNGQILMQDYDYSKSLLVLKEMVDKLVLELVENRYVCGGIGLEIRYSKERRKSTGTSKKLTGFTNSQQKIRHEFEELFVKTTLKDVAIRKIYISLNDLLPEEYTTIDFFTDVEKEKKEHELLDTVIGIKRKFGRNSILKGMSYQEGSTAMERNKMIGGHNGGEEDD